VVYIISINHHTDVVIGELIQPSVDRNVTAVSFGI